MTTDKGIREMEKGLPINGNKMMFQLCNVLSLSLSQCRRQLREGHHFSPDLIETCTARIQPNIYPTTSSTIWNLRNLFSHFLIVSYLQLFPSFMDIVLGKSGILFLFPWTVSGPVEVGSTCSPSKCHYLIHKPYPGNHDLSREIAIYRTSWFLPPFFKPTTCFLPNLRSMYLTLHPSSLSVLYQGRFE